MFPLVPTDGVVQVNSPSGSATLAATNVEFAGTALTSCTWCAAPGPLSAIVTRKLIVAPELTADDPFMASMERSAEAATMPAIPVVTVLLLSEVLGSGVDAVIVAVLLMMPDGALGDVLTDSVKLV